MAEEVAVGLHHDIAQMHADPHLGLALVCEGERGLDGGQARTELQHEAIARGVEHAPALRRGDAFDHAPERRHLGRGPRLIGFRACGIARDVERNDRGEFAGQRIVRHTVFRVRVFPFGNRGNPLLPLSG